MSRRPAHTAFDMAHPAVAAVYVVLTLVLTMGSVQPVLTVISLAGAFAYACCVRGVRASVASLRWQLPLVLLIAVANPLFSASGSTELFRIGLRAVYLESLCYGATMGALFVASVLWFQAASVMLSEDKVMALVGNAAPTLALMVSMCLRLIPRFVRQGRLVAAVQEVVEPDGADAAGRTRRAIDAGRLRLRLSTVLMGWGLEDSLETADAMRARGWGAAPRRTSYTRFRFTARDAALVAALLAGGAVCAVIAAAATSQFQFYPTMSRLVVWWGYVPYALWMFVPVIGHVCERRRFQ